jgi:hypothetical protein
MVAVNHRLDGKINVKGENGPFRHQLGLHFKLSIKSCGFGVRRGEAGPDEVSLSLPDYVTLIT